MGTKIGQKMVFLTIGPVSPPEAPGPPDKQMYTLFLFYKHPVYKHPKALKLAKNKHIESLARPPI